METPARSMAGGALWHSLLFLCGGGLLLAWMPDRVAWSVFEALVFVVLLAWTVGWAMGKLRASWPALFLPLLGVMAWGAVQLRMGWSAYRFATETDLVRWGCYFSILFLAYQLSSVPGRGRAFRRIFVTYALALAVISVLQLFAGNGKIYWLFQPAEPAGLGPFLNPDHYASFVALALPAALFEMVRHSRGRWFFLVATAALYASVIASASRAGFVLLTLELLILFAMLGFRQRTVPAVAALLAAFVLVVGWEALYNRLRAPDPYNGRREVAAATVNMIRSNPWKGFGLGTWTEVYPAYAQKDFGVFVNAAHNDWLQWWADGGVPVLACLALLVCGAIILVPRAPWSLGVPIVFLHALVDFPMQGRFLPAIVFLVLGVAAGKRRRNEAAHATAR